VKVRSVVHRVCRNSDTTHRLVCVYRTDCSTYYMENYYAAKPTA